MKTPEKLYVVKDKHGRLTKPYKALHFAKMKMRSENDMIITYTIESEETLKSIKREQRLSKILDGEDTEIDSNITSLFKKYSIGLRELPKVLNKNDLKRLVVRNKRKLFVKLETVNEFETLLKFHNFRKMPYGFNDKTKQMFYMAKQNIKGQLKNP